MGAFSPSLEKLRSAIEDELAQFCDERKAAVPESTDLIDEILRLLEAGGKRLRPAFCYWGFRASGALHEPAIVRAASSLELLHTFAIVHDDIMDDADERRGIPTPHVVHGLGFALLVGDLALVLADALLLGAGFDAGVLMSAFGAYSLMRQEVIAGQQLDLVYSSRSNITEDEARRVALLKSGRYSIEKPLVIGGRLANAPEAFIRGLSRFGDPLGEAFQLRDDLLGTFGERANIGKPVDSDVREGKRNLLYATAARGLRGADREFFVGRWGGDDLKEEEIERLKELIEESGARRATEELLARASESAAAALRALPVDAESRAALDELARLAVERDI
jgi:geranylgeranyl diphosphate synthase, type I